MNNGLKITTLLSVLATSTLIAQIGDFRSPLSVQRGSMHWDLQPLENTSWFENANECNRPDWMLHYGNRNPKDIKNPEINCHQFYFEKWAAGFTRSARDAYFRGNTSCGDSDNRNTRHTSSLAALFLGAESFRGIDAFANSTLTSLALAQNNSLLGSALIRPEIQYNEKGVYWGGRVEYRWGNENKWHVGGRLNFPFKIVDVEVLPGGEETLEDLFSVRTINVSDDIFLPNNQQDISIRLDFLNSLEIDQSTPLLQVSGSGATQNIQVAEATISALTAEGTPSSVPALYPVRASNQQELINISASKANSGSFRRQASEVNGGALPANGLDGTDGTVFFLQTGTQYQAPGALLTNDAAQSTLFLVPRADDANVNILSPQTSSAVSRIINAVQQADLTDRLASDFFVDQGINFSRSERVVGVGDMDGEFYFGYGDKSYMYMQENKWCHWYADGIFGIKFPTGTKAKEKNATHIFRLETGNNRHWELSIGTQGGIQPCNYFAFDMRYCFHHAFKRSQYLPATFIGSSVRGVGPVVKGDVSWHYHELDFNFNFFHPCNKDLGCVLSYKLFAKQKDKISYCPTVATDFLGTMQTLSSDLAGAHTKSMLHKFGGEIFHRWNFFEVFAGGSHAVGGRDAMNESEGHLGFSIYF